MRGRLGFLVGFGAGYVLGSKAGKERYEQLRRLYDNLVTSPQFKEASGKAKGTVESGIGQAKEKVSEGVSKVQEVVKEKKSGDERSGLSVAPPPTH